MSFCCGASMIGAKGTVKHIHTRIHNVPLLFCPVCHHTEVHYLVKNEYEILAEYAYADGANDVDFSEYVDEKDDTALFENCINHEKQNPLEVITTQIDMALDLMSVAKQIEDEAWEKQLKKRLKVMSERRKKWIAKHTTGKTS